MTPGADPGKRLSGGHGAAAGDAVFAKYSPAQPRVPAGSPGGGQWTDGGGVIGGGAGTGVLTGGSGFDKIQSFLENPMKLFGSGDAKPANPQALDETALDPASNSSLQQAIDHLNGAAHQTSQHQCAKYVRPALAAGGITVISPAARPGNSAASAADIGPSLVAAGACLVADVQGQVLGAEAAGYPPDGYTEKPGDVIVFPSFPGHRHGRMAMWNGEQWISDFKQHGPWPTRVVRKPTVRDT